VHNLFFDSNVIFTNYCFELPVNVVFVYYSLKCGMWDDLSLNRYKEVVHEQVDHLAPQEILANLAKLEVEIQQGMEKLEALLK
jgi:hypothetical protein